MKMFTVPRIIVIILFLLCFILNAISIGLCLSALFLLILAYLDLGHLLGEVNKNNNHNNDHHHHNNNEILTTYTISSTSLSSSTFYSISYPSIDENNASINSKNFLEIETTPTTSTSIGYFDFNPEPLLPESNPDQLNLIFYLLFYLAVAILGIMGASIRYQRNKISYLTCHVLLLWSIICFNLLAWFHFRTYSPLNNTSSEDPNLLLASLFDFVDFLVGLSLLISLFINRKHHNNVRIKQRNSITPITESPNGSSQSYNIP